MSINWWTVGSLYGAASVAFGAFGAHGLKARGVPDAKIASWSTAAHYQLIHSVALLVTETAFPGKQKIWAKSLLTAGMTMFSGYVHRKLPFLRLQRQVCRSCADFVS